jgi:hypothetical protein
MELIKTYFLLIVLILNFSCSGDQEKSQKFGDVYLREGSGWHQDAIPTDTINKTDSKGKQGKWVIRKRSDERSLTNSDIIDSSGYYLDNKKIGYWKKYSKDHSVIDSVLYERGIPKIEANKTYTFSSN